MSENKIVIKNQLRNHFKPNLFNKLKTIFLLRNCNEYGKNIIIDKNVNLMRFPERIFIGNNVILKEGTKLCPTNSNAKIVIGDQTTLGYFSMIFSSNQIIIGDNCMIAPYCYIIDSNHQTKKELLLNKQPIEAQSITIEDDVWIGVGSKILMGVTIHRGAVIAAGSLVIKDVPEYEIHSGVPCQKIGNRL